ncbi:MAG: sulfatase-like hydrolase/transferase [Cyclobacteriaceae bacterium]
MIKTMDIKGIHLKACFLLAMMFTVANLIAQTRPNIIFIESDDQSNQAVGAFGNPDMVTPNIDLLAKKGVSFTSAYNMGCWSPAVCVPSRTMLFYGKYLWDSQKITTQNAPKSMVELLKEAGYTTYMTGKWHAWGKKPGELFDELGSIQPGQLKTYRHEQGHVTDITGQEAVTFIESHKSEDPFFLYVAFNAPHVPRETSQYYYDLYPTEGMPLPPSVIEGPLNPNIEYNYTSDPLQAATMRSRRQQNNAMVTHMDDRIGDIIKALKEKDIYDESIIVFMSDHGISFGENGVAGKVCLYEPSVTAPLIIKSPNLPTGVQFDERVYLQDIYPTLLEMVGLQKPDFMQFESLIPIVKESASGRASIYLAMFDSQRGIVKGSDKLIYYPISGDYELYDLSIDPWETNNLASSESNMIAPLLKELREWQTIVNDPLDLSDTYSAYFD